MSEKLSVADVLERAADLIEPKGRWIQGILREADGKCFCALGALIEISPMGFEAANYLESMLPRVAVTDAFRPIAKWNDDPTRKQAEVVAKLREAAAISRALPGGEGK